MNKVLIYADGGLKLGLGNIYRMLELARSLVRDAQDINVTFVTSSDKYVVDLIQDNGFKVEHSLDEDIKSLINQLKFKVLIIDKLNIEKDFVRTIQNNKSKKFRTVIFGNLSDANELADLVINAIIGTNFSNRNYVDEFNTHYLTGPRYLALRDEFKPRIYEYRNSLKKILLLFGGSDQANLSIKILKKLIEANDDYQITVVIGRGYVFLSELEVWVKNKNNITILRDITNVKEVMLDNDFLFTSPGTAMFEGFFLGLPLLALFQNESQKEVFRDFFMTKSYDEIENVESRMKNIYWDIENYYKELDKLEIAQGKKDIVNHIIKLI